MAKNMEDNLYIYSKDNEIEDKNGKQTRMNNPFEDDYSKV